MKSIIISGFSGIGKTTVAKKYKNQVIDLESSDFKWIFKDDNTANMEVEARKGEQNKVLNKNWPHNYFEAIIEATKVYDIVLIAQGNDIRDLLLENEIEYMLCFPAAECKEEYINRYILRGNPPSFVELIKANFENWVQDLMKCPEQKLIINSGKYLEDVLKENGLI